MKRPVTQTLSGWLTLLALTLTTPALAQAELAEDVREYRLENGLRVIMVERGVAPVIDFNLTFDTGGVDEPPGLGGVAHMVEHMALMMGVPLLLVPAQAITLMLRALPARGERSRRN